MHTFIYVRSARQRDSGAGRRGLGAAAGCVLASVYTGNSGLQAICLCIARNLSAYCWNLPGYRLNLPWYCLNMPVYACVLPAKLICIYIFNVYTFLVHTYMYTQFERGSGIVYYICST